MSTPTSAKTGLMGVHISVYGINQCPNHRHLLNCVGLGMNRSSGHEKPHAGAATGRGHTRYAQNLLLIIITNIHRAGVSR